jgi:predicted dehydrogenase
MLRGGVFGFGGVGQAKTKQLNERAGDARVVAVCDVSETARQKASSFGDLAACSSIDELLSHKLDFVLILSTTSAHGQAAKACLERGIPFLIEKPITLDLAEAEQLIRLAREHNVIHAVNYSMRYRPEFKLMKRMLAQGELGRPVSLWAHKSRGHGFYETGARHPAVVRPDLSGGWLIHHMCHIVDFAVWMLGPVRQVHAVTTTTAPVGLQSEEAIGATMAFQNGAVASLFDQAGGIIAEGYGVTGTAGGIKLAEANGHAVLHHHAATDAEWGPPRVLDPQKDFAPEDGLSHFLTCVREGRPSDVPLWEAFESLRVCHALRDSARKVTG